MKSVPTNPSLPFTYCFSMHVQRKQAARVLFQVHPVCSCLLFSPSNLSAAFVGSITFQLLLIFFHFFKVHPSDLFVYVMIGHMSTFTNIILSSFQISARYNNICRMSHLRFADDIFLCTETPQELQQMLQELSDESRRMGLKMNITKTKVMVVDNTPINVNNVLIENVQGYVYLGQHYSLKEKNQDKEIQRRIMAGWAAYAKHRDIFISNLAICLKRQVYNSCVLPAMTYDAETWTLTKQAQNKLAAAQTKMERSMLNTTYKDRKTNIWVRERTKVIDIMTYLTASKLAGSS